MAPRKLQILAPYASRLKMRVFLKEDSMTKLNPAKRTKGIKPAIPSLKARGEMIVFSVSIKLK
jgi:hypothetical protein